MPTRVLLFLCLLASPLLTKHVDIPAPFEDDCIIDHGTNLYDPKNADHVKWYDIDLDGPAFAPFVEIARDYSDSMKAMIQVLKDLILPVYTKAVDVIDAFFGAMHQLIPQPYQDEIASIAEASGIPLGQIVMYNLIYEVTSACTSVVGVDEKGKLYHARNLDFGLWMGCDHTVYSNYRTN
ncbi:hypothetical protein PENTCL1PPCAC_16463 [Pristionchus entomophagus]|uniref:ceramidase n=1 Tax=Pristionchus entomophagus TaxID=358040 RepID=A0AAV5TIU2_9BILA|nr:hypothetical protein PENTCL1PPCAC_16463 [Pristionchus entomophagus]